MAKVNPKPSDKVIKSRKRGPRTSRSMFRLEAKNNNGVVSVIGEMRRKSDVEEFLRLVDEHGLGDFEKVRSVRIISSNQEW